ncbi:hypothetical protein D0T90_00810 [Neisseria animalis]|uniref:Uncharacterized protein n=1 Tax=Neisseria animalis TaxID=492 RepID=A0A5P3MR11_NEIAN|nr:hypothetical protein D0T90_00810 [Neisseria animalis]ROW31804.1 hypothetical protein CGZ60_08525 [Neisseria animalis]
MPCRTMCTVCGFAALSHSYFIRLYLQTAFPANTRNKERKTGKYRWITRNGTRRQSHGWCGYGAAGRLCHQFEKRGNAVWLRVKKPMLPKRLSGRLMV